MVRTHYPSKAKAGKKATTEPKTLTTTNWHTYVHLDRFHWTSFSPESITYSPYRQILPLHLQSTNQNTPHSEARIWAFPLSVRKASPGRQGGKGVILVVYYCCVCCVCVCMYVIEYAKIGVYLLLVLMLLIWLELDLRGLLGDGEIGFFLRDKFFSITTFYLCSGGFVVKFVWCGMSLSCSIQVVS